MVSSAYQVPPFGILLLAAVLLLSHPKLVTSDESEKSILDSYDHATILFENCDVETYYKDHRDGEWGWNRVDVASLLLRTHRQIIPSEASLEFLSEEASMNISSLSREFALNTDTRKVLTELDKGNFIQDDNVTIDTVHMIFTKTDVAVEDGLIMGWEPGYLWPMDNVKDSVSGELDTDYQEEAIAAIHDLHNIWPRHPIVHYGQRTNKWYYDTCRECKLDKGQMTVEQRMEGRAADTRAEWDGIKFDLTDFRMDGDNAVENDWQGTDDLCVCRNEHALQPPEKARGEVARALLYMNLRYGTLTSDAAYLDLALTDCHPLISGDGGDYDDNESTNPGPTNNIGYFSRLVKWHLEDPPKQREIDRNDAICQHYQGNRNPFVDFYEESWALLDFERIEREVCAGDNWLNDDDYGARDESPHTTTKDSSGFGCGELMPGDVSFFMVQPSPDEDEITDISAIDDWQRKTFGLVTLVDLRPGLVLYVAGVGDDTNDETVGLNGEEKDDGILRFEVPTTGIPTGSYFGHGNRMNLGTRWQPIMEPREKRSDFRFSVDQLYLFCAEESDEIESSNTNEAYKILAALSTTGRSFGNDGLPSYWEKFKEEHSDVTLSEYFSNGIHYGVIVLPEDASDSQKSGGYRYVGPAYEKHDLYAKALINEAYWKRMKSLDGVESIYGSAEDSPADNVEELQPRLDENIVDSSGNSPRLFHNGKLAALVCSITVVVYTFFAALPQC